MIQKTDARATPPSDGRPVTSDQRLPETAEAECKEVRLSPAESKKLKFPPVEAKKPRSALKTQPNKSNKLQKFGRMREPLEFWHRSPISGKEAFPSQVMEEIKEIRDAGKLNTTAEEIEKMLK